MKAHLQNALPAFTLTLRDRLRPSPGCAGGFAPSL